MPSIGIKRNIYIENGHAHTKIYTFEPEAAKAEYEITIPPPGELVRPAGIEKYRQCGMRRNRRRGEIAVDIGRWRN